MTPAPGTDGLGDNMLVGAVKEGDEGVGGFEAVEAELGEGGEAGVRGGGGGAGEGGEVGDGVVGGRGGERGGDAEVVVSLVGGWVSLLLVGGGGEGGGDYLKVSRSRTGSETRAGLAVILRSWGRRSWWDRVVVGRRAACVVSRIPTMSGDEDVS